MLEEIDFYVFFIYLENIVSKLVPIACRIVSKSGHIFLFEVFTRPN